MKKNIVEKKIMWGDLDSLGIVFYPRYYEWIDASGHLFFESIGLTIGDLWKERHLLFGLAETSCRYFRPGRYHQKIRIVTCIEEMGAKTLTLRHSIEEAGGGERLLAEGLEKRVCMDVSDIERFRAVEIPKDIREKLELVWKDAPLRGPSSTPA